MIIDDWADDVLLACGLPLGPETRDEGIRVRRILRALSQQAAGEQLGVSSSQLKAMRIMFTLRRAGFAWCVLGKPPYFPGAKVGVLLRRDAEVDRLYVPGRIAQEMVPQQWRKQQ